MCIPADSHHKHGAKKQILKAKRLATNKRKERRKVRRQKRSTITIEANKNQIKNLSNKDLQMNRLIYWQKGLNSFQHPWQNKHKSDNNSCLTLISLQQECVLCKYFEGKTTNPILTMSNLHGNHQYKNQ